MIKSSFIYAATDDGKRHKIGHTGDLRKRLANLQTGHSRPLVYTTAFSVPACRARAIEKRIHQEVPWRRLRGKWFALDRSQIADLFAFAQIRWLENDLIKPAFPMDWEPVDPLEIIGKSNGKVLIQGA